MFGHLGALYNCLIGKYDYVKRYPTSSVLLSSVPFRSRQLIFHKRLISAVKDFNPLNAPLLIISRSSEAEPFLVVITRRRYNQLANAETDDDLGMIIDIFSVYVC